MKKNLVVLLSLFALPALADMRSELRAHQKTIGNSAGGAAAVPKAGVTSSGPQVSAPMSRCEEVKGTTLPLSTFLDSVLDADPKLNIDHDPRTGILTVSSAKMIGNCSSMLEWSMQNKQINARNTYAVSINFKKGTDCTFVKDAAGADTKEIKDCKYKVTKKNGDTLTNDDMVFEPTLAGYKKCLADSGVLKPDGKVNEDGIFPEPVNYPFPNAKESGDVVFMSHGKPAVVEKAAYGDFLLADGCDYFEKVSPQMVSVRSAEEVDNAALQAQADGLKNCQLDQLQSLSDFLERNPAFANLAEHRERLLIQAAQDAAKKIAAGTASDEDLSVLDDFEKYILQPRIEQLKAMMDNLANASGPQKTAMQKQIDDLKKGLSAFINAPYFPATFVAKLVEKGNFDAAERLFGIRAQAAIFAKLGQKINNVDVTANEADKQISQARVQFGIQLETEKEKFAIRTGQSSGQAAALAQNAQQLRKDIQERIQNYNAEINSLAQKMQKECSQYWVNKTTCAQKYQADIQALQVDLKQKTEADTSQASQFEAKAKEYQALEDQGRKAIAAANGEPVPQPSRTAVPNRTAASTQDNAAAQLAQLQQQQQQQMMAMQQQQMQASMNQWQQQMMGASSMQQYPTMNAGGFFGQQNMGMNNGFYSSPYLSQQSNMMGMNPMMMMGQQNTGFYGGMNTGFNMNLGGMANTGYSPYTMGNYNLYGLR